MYTNSILMEFSRIFLELMCIEERQLYILNRDLMLNSLQFMVLFNYSLKSNDDLLLLPEQKLTGTVGNYRHRYLCHCRVIICERPLTFNFFLQLQ